MSADLVSRWIEAHNERDIERMIACTTRDVEFRPLRLTDGADTLYVGPDGLRLWRAQLLVDHRLRPHEVRELENQRVLVIGAVDVPGASIVAEFYGMYEISDGLIARAQHFISDRKTIEDLGLIRPPGS